MTPTHEMQELRKELAEWRDRQDAMLLEAFERIARILARIEERLGAEPADLPAPIAEKIQAPTQEHIVPAAPAKAKDAPAPAAAPTQPAKAPTPPQPAPTPPAAPSATGSNTTSEGTTQVGKAKEQA